MAVKPPKNEQPSGKQKHTSALLTEIGRITCDLVWIKRELKYQRLMLESLGARTELTEEEINALNSVYIHDDEKHVTTMGPGSACDNG